jgi:hypothetical protein
MLIDGTAKTVRLTHVNVCIVDHTSLSLSCKVRKAA